MASQTVSVVYTNGVSYIEIPEGFNPDGIYLLMNGQVWTSDSLEITGSTIAIEGVDLSDELVQVSDLSSASSTTDPVVTNALGDIINILSGDSTSTVAASDSNTTTITTDTTSEIVTTIPTINFLQSKGMNAETGESLSGIDHLRQSLRNIIMTPTWQRVMRRDYGSDIHEKLDHPGTSANVLQIYAQLADALEKWEPRFDLQKINASVDSGQGAFTFSFEGDYLGQYISSGEIVV